MIRRTFSWGPAASLISLALILSSGAYAKDKVVINRETQKVDFEGDTVEGVARHPDGAYLVQKRSVDFLPLYKVRERFDENIRSSIDYLK
jgi:hypothetical protein